MTKAADLGKLGPEVLNTAKKLEDLGASFSQSNFLFSVIDKDNQVVTQTPISGMAFGNLPAEFDPSNLSAMSLSKTIGAVLNQAFVKITGGASGLTMPDLSKIIDTTTMGEPAAPQVIGIDAAIVDAANSTFSTIDTTKPPPNPYSFLPYFKGDLKTSPTVGLAFADALLQPVKGTGGGSRYFLMWKGHNGAVAIRWKAGSLSVRIEGANPQAKEDFKVAGFFGGGAEGAVSTSHMSMHLSVSSVHQVATVLGAIYGLMAMRTQQTPFPSAEVIMKVYGI